MRLVCQLGDRFPHFWKIKDFCEEFHLQKQSNELSHNFGEGGSGPKDTLLFGNGHMLRGLVRISVGMPHGYICQIHFCIQHTKQGSKRQTPCVLRMPLE